MSVAIPEKVLELAMDAEVEIRNETDHPTDIIARAIMQDRADRARQRRRRVMSRAQVFIAFMAAGIGLAIVRQWAGSFGPVEEEAALYVNRVLGAGGALALHWILNR